MSVAKPRIRSSAVRAQQDTAVVASDHKQTASDFGGPKFGSRCKLCHFIMHMIREYYNLYDLFSSLETVSRKYSEQRLV